MTGEQNNRKEISAARERANESIRDSSPENELVSDWDFRNAEIAKRDGACLPHWTAEGATYAVTFRLADSLPQVVLEAFVRERDQLFRKTCSKDRGLTMQESKRLRELHSARIEAYLDSGKGDCVLGRANVAQIVKDAIQYFDGRRYDILAWCVMPNHVHVVVRPCPGHELRAILQSWKSFTANLINKSLGRTGPLWQVEYFDHLIRDADELEHSIRYVLENPHSAGLSDWPWSGTSFLSGQ